MLFPLVSMGFFFDFFVVICRKMSKTVELCRTQAISNTYDAKKFWYSRFFGIFDIFTT